MCWKRPDSQRQQQQTSVSTTALGLTGPELAQTAQQESKTPLRWASHGPVRVTAPGRESRRARHGARAGHGLRLTVCPSAGAEVAEPHSEARTRQLEPSPPVLDLPQTAPETRAPSRGFRVAYSESRIPSRGFRVAGSE